MNPILKLPIEIISIIIDFSNKTDIESLKLAYKKLYMKIMQYRLSNGLTRIMKFDNPELLEITTSAKIDYHIPFNYNSLSNIKNLHLHKLNFTNKLTNLVDALKNLNVYKLKISDSINTLEKINIPNSVKYLNICECIVNDIVIDVNESKLKDITFDLVTFKHTNVLKNTIHKLKNLNSLQLIEIDTNNPVKSYMVLPKYLDYLKIVDAKFPIYKNDSYGDYNIKNIDIDDYFLDTQEDFNVIKNTESLKIRDSLITLSENLILKKLKTFDADLLFREYNEYKLILPNLFYLKLNDDNIDSLDVNPNLSKLVINNSYFKLSHIQKMINLYPKLKYLKIDTCIDDNNYITMNLPELECLYVNNRYQLNIVVNSKKLQTVNLCHVNINGFGWRNTITSLKLYGSVINDIDYKRLRELYLKFSTIRNLKQLYYFRELKFVKIHCQDYLTNVKFITNQKLIENNIYDSELSVECKK